MKKLGVFLSWSALLAYTALTGFVVVLLLFVTQLYYVGKKTFLLPNLVLLALGVAVAVGLTLLLVRHLARVEGWLARYSKWAIGLCSMLFLVALCYLSYHAFFHVGWDAAVMDYVAQLIAAGGDPLPDFVHEYYSSYPNNLFLTWLFAQLLNIPGAVEFFPSGTPCMVLVWFQAVLSVLASLMLYHLVLRFTKKYCAAWLAWLAYVLLVGTSFWVLVPYSDATGLFFPVALLWLYQGLKQTKCTVCRLLLWFVLMSMTYYGYHIKPTVAIVFLAIVIAEGVGFLQRGASPAQYTPKQFGVAAATLAVLLGAVLCAGAVYQQVVVPSTNIILDEEAEFGATHFFMMGLNPDTDGVCATEDQDFSASFDTKADRAAANLQVAADRIVEFGAAGLSVHYIKKLMMNFGDATFAWGNEGDFYMMEYTPADNFIEPILSNLRHSDNASYQYIATFYQFIWLFALASSVGLVLLYRRQSQEGKHFLLVLAIALLGMLLYSMLFEARARYLYLYTPLYLAAATFGWLGVVQTVRHSAFVKHYLTKQQAKSSCRV